MDIGVDAGTGMAHGVEATAANVHDLDVEAEAEPELIRGDDDLVNGGAGYAGIEERDEIKNDGHCLKSITGLTSGRGRIRNGMINY
jgi:IS5 family transposase